MATDRRAQFRKGLSSLYVPIYDGLCTILGPEWQPYCGERSIAEQDRLYRIGRGGLPGPVVTNSQGGVSAHNYGCASDWIKFDSDGKPIWVLTRTEWKEYGMAVEKAGGRWGADWDMDGKTRQDGDMDERFVDRPHNELPIACAWKQVDLIRKKTNMLAAQQHIEKNLLG